MPWSAVSRARTASSGKLGERVAGRCRRARAPRRTRPCSARSRRRRAPPRARSASRSRVGNAQASPGRTPKRSISRLRIASAEKSDTCCDVIAPTSISNGSGRERRAGSRRAAGRSGPACRRRPPTRRTDPARTRARRPRGRPARSPRRAARRRRRPPPPRCAPRARRRRDGARPRARAFTRSTPNARKRSVVSAKSNGSGTARNAMPRRYWPSEPREARYRCDVNPAPDASSTSPGVSALSYHERQ